MDCRAKSVHAGLADWLSARALSAPAEVAPVFRDRAAVHGALADGHARAELLQNLVGHAGKPAFLRLAKGLG